MFNALQYLQQHSPAYADIRIVPERLAALPDSGVLDVAIVDASRHCDSR